jgi:glycerol-3-phosphate dehydrogenase
MAKAKTARTATTPNPKVTSISGPSFASEGKKKQTAIDVESEIRQRAYELYVQRGFEPGHENDDWLIAEREILSRPDAQQSA